jgi:hypothetical protein
LRHHEVVKTCRCRRLGEASPTIKPLLCVEKRCRGKDLKGGASELMRRSELIQVGSVNEVAAQCPGEL